MIAEKLTYIPVDPVYAFSFLQTFIEILQEYFGTVTAATLKDNFDVVYQVRTFHRAHEVVLPLT